MLMATIIESAHLPHYEDGLKKWDYLDESLQRKLYEEVLHDLQVMLKASHLLEEQTHRTLDRCTGGK